MVLFFVLQSKALKIFAFWDLFFLIFRKLTANYKSEFDLLRAPAIARNVSVPDSLCVETYRKVRTHFKNISESSGSA